jgi:hypothetical protein
MLPMSWVTNRSLTPSPFRVVVTGIWGHGAQGKLPYSSIMQAIIEISDLCNLIHDIKRVILCGAITFSYRLPSGLHLG